jgi:hypothetical protein
MHRTDEPVTQCIRIRRWQKQSDLRNNQKRAKRTQQKSEMREQSAFEVKFELLKGHKTNTT